MWINKTGMAVLVLRFFSDHAWYRVLFWLVLPQSAKNGPDIPQRTWEGGGGGDKLAGGATQPTAGGGEGGWSFRRFLRVSLSLLRSQAWS